MEGLLAFIIPTKPYLVNLWQDFHMRWSHPPTFVFSPQVRGQLKRIGFTKQSDILVILAAIDQNMDGFLDYFELERLRSICNDALDEYYSNLHPFRPWVKHYTHIGPVQHRSSLRLVVPSSHQAAEGRCQPNICLENIRNCCGNWWTGLFGASGSRRRFSSSSLDLINRGSPPPPQELTEVEVEIGEEKGKNEKKRWFQISLWWWSWDQNDFT